MENLIHAIMAMLWASIGAPPAHYMYMVLWLYFYISLSITIYSIYNYKEYESVRSLIYLLSTKGFMASLAFQTGTMPGQ